jgi:hypothetical protein
MSDAPEIVREVLSMRRDFSFGYHSIDIPVTFTEVPWDPARVSTVSLTQFITGGV